MKFRNLLSILSLSLVASIGAFYGLTKNNEAKPVKAEEVAKFCIRNGDELEMNYNDETFEWYIQDVELDASEEFIINYDDILYGAEYFDFDVIGQTFYGGEDSYIGVYEAGTYNFYFIFNDSDSNIRPEVDPTMEAERWAIDFLDNLNCSDTYDEAPSNWGEWADNFQTFLSDGAKDLFVEAVASIDSGATIIQKAAYIHDLCVSKYEDCNVFMYYEGGSRSYLITRTNSNNIEFNSVALIITVASVTSITLLLTLLVIKKHKK